MSAKFDVVIVGAGHNCLTAAAYLARSGVSVQVLEQHDFIGGGTVSRELTVPGFIHDPHATGIAHLQAHPIVTHDELGLISRHGLEFAYPDASFMTVFDDGETLSCYKDLDRTCAEIARFSEPDAASYRRMAEFMAGIGPVVGMAMNRPAPGFGAFVAMLEQMPVGRELLLAMLKSAYDVVIENFEHPRVRMHFLKWAAETLCGPEEKTTGINMFFLIGSSHSAPGGLVKGGTQKLSNALRAAIEDNGGEIRCGAQVKRVLVSGGTARAVELADGEVIEARKAVIAAIHPHMLGAMVEGIDSGVAARAAATHGSLYAEVSFHCALSERPKWNCGEGPNNSLGVNLIDSMEFEEFRRIFDDLRYGDIPKRFIGHVACHTNLDPSRAPESKHTLYYIHLVPFELRGGAQRWDEVKEKHADYLLERLGRYAPNVPGAVMGRHIESPLDMQRYSRSFTRGDVMGLGSYIYQSLGMRPTMELAQYRVPGAQGLYLCGPFMHPGGGVTGGGRPVAMRVMDDLGVDYSKVIRA
ncbi:NAD(P)/FAD-dependent oxidoreductase [Sphingobium sp.]|uniref:phytoene desaturase family protein n=1 Tax=Sphingobium sp. TaxID=1912891 RepID=UPI0028BE53CD|nr:NAD(P)/FAD-dependent oxidoreductase [Sphingobium sp.]